MQQADVVVKICRLLSECGGARVRIERGLELPGCAQRRAQVSPVRPLLRLRPGEFAEQASSLCVLTTSIERDRDEVERDRIARSQLEHLASRALRDIGATLLQCCIALPDPCEPGRLGARRRQPDAFIGHRPVLHNPSGRDKAGRAARPQRGVWRSFASGRPIGN